MQEEARESALVSRLNGVVASDREGFVRRLDGLGTAILDDGLLAGPPAPIGYYELARLFEYFVLDASLPKPDPTGQRPRRISKDPVEKSGRREKRRWKVLLDLYKELQGRVAGSALPIVGVPNLRQFCDFESMKQGSRDARLYASLLVLAAYMDEAGLFATERYERAMPKCERDLPQRIRAVVDAELLGVAPAPEPVAAKPETPAPPPEPRDPSIYLRVAYRRADAEQFDDYRSHYAHSESGAAHFVVYRPSRSRPSRLMKSFLSISAAAPERYGDEEPDVFSFTHIYSPPDTSDGSTQRITLGRVFPLENGVYLVGGQRNYLQNSGRIRQRLRAKSLKAMVLPWTKLSNRDFVLPILAMSTNYGGFHLVTRAAMRATPAHSSKDLRIGAVEVGEIMADLLEDARRERAMVSSAELSESGRFQLCRQSNGEQTVERVAKTILRLTNDAPDQSRGWEVPPGYVGAKGVPLTNDRLRQQLAGALERNGRPTFSRTEGSGTQPFSLLGSLRFGPLIQAD